MADVVSWIHDRSSHTAHTYGGHDPWSAAPADPLPARDNLVVYAAESGHEASLTNITDADRARILARLAVWADTSVVEPHALHLELDRVGRHRAAEAFSLDRAR